MRSRWVDRRRTALFIVLIAALSALHAAAREAPTESPVYESVTVEGAGVLSGAVRLPGPPPKVPDIKVTKDESLCGSRMPGERIVRADDGGLQNAVVSIERISKGKPIDLSRPVRLNIQRCRFDPHVLALAAGQKLEMFNGDPILHNPHGRLSGLLSVFDIALPYQNQKVPKVLTEPGMLKVTCDDGHIWMEAYVHVFPHPYFAVTDERGNFRIAGIPPGAYTLRAWQEVLGTQFLDVTIAAGQETKAVFEGLSTK